MSATSKRDRAVRDGVLPVTGLADIEDMVDEILADVMAENSKEIVEENEDGR
jgi:hypothetical protein